MQYAAMSSFPAVSRNAPDILRLFGPESDSIQRAAQRALQVKQPVAGLDLEFTGDTPTVLGVSDGSLTVSVSWAEGLPYLRELLELHPDIIWAGHAIVSADLFVLRAAGIDLKLTNLQDTIIWHWLNNANLCKGTGKVEDNDGTAKGRGYMNLWTFASLYASYPNWKICRESECDGTYCPEHDMYGYNGADSQIPLVALAPAVMQSRLRGTTHLYDLHRELMYVLTDMSRYGIQTDGPYIETLREELARDRERVARSLTFSPTSPKQVVEHFKSKGIRLADAQETTVREACEEYDDLELHALLEFKELGNGPDRWFGDRFVDAGGRVHPRISIFTSSARMMCSGPNFQNLGHWRVNRRQCECGHRVEGHSDWIAACSECPCAKFKPVNIGGKVRRGVVASPGTYLAKFDLKNGEGRVMFHFAGIQVPADAHTFTADLCKLTDDMEYCRREGGRRQAAKKIVHACVTGDHEVLTPQGWIPIARWTGQPIAEWAQTGITFNTPKEYHKYEVDEELVSLYGTSLSSIATKEHKFPVVIRGNWQDRSYAKCRPQIADAFLKSGYIPTSGILHNEDLDVSDDEIRRAVAIQADASHHKKAPKNWLFHVVKARKKERLEALFGKEGRPCKCHAAGGGMYYSVNFESILLNEHKTFTNALLRLSQRQREIFLDEVLLWDGHVRPDHKEYMSKNYSCVRWVQTLAHLSGKQALFRITRYPGGFTGKPCVMNHLSFNRRTYAAINRLEKKSVPFKGDVYCFTTNTGYFLVRHNERIYVTGNSSYLEGIQLKTATELRSANIQKEISYGARVVYPDWTFEGKIVTFTGANFSQRVWGDKTLANRKKTIDLIEGQYFANIPAMREFQKRITGECERHRAIVTPLGYYISSYGQAEDRCKTTAAVWGSQPVGHLTKIGLVRAGRAFAAGRPMRPLLQEHDSILYEVAEHVPPEQAVAWMHEDGVVEMPEIPGLTIPLDCGVSLPTANDPSNWRDIH